jgi:hypothetical protein
MTQPVNWGQLVEQAGGDFEPLPKGDYDVRVDSAEATTSSTGKMMFKLKFKVVGGPNNGRTLFNNITLSTDNPNALRMFFMNMKAFGLDPAFFNQNPGPDTVAAGMVGKEVRVKVDHQTYNGQLRENIKQMLPPMGGATAAPAPVASSVPEPIAPSVPSPVSAPIPPSDGPTPPPVPF